MEYGLTRLNFCQDFLPPQDVVLKEIVYPNLIGQHFLQDHESKSLLLVKCGNIIKNREHKQVCGFTEILAKVTVEQSSLDLLFMQRPDCGEPLVEDIPQKMKKFDRSQ